MPDVVGKDGVVVGNLVVLAELQDHRQADASRWIRIAIRSLVTHVRRYADRLVDELDGWISFEVSS